MILSPIIGMVVAFGIMVALLNLLKKLTPATVTKYFKKLQIDFFMRRFFQSRFQRCPEDDGGHNIPADRDELHQFRRRVIPRSGLGCSNCLYGDRAGHVCRRVEDNQDHGNADHPSGANSWLCSPDSFRRGDSWSESFRNPCEHNSRRLGVNNGGGFHEEILCCPLGYREKDSVGLDHHDSDVCTGRWSCLLDNKCVGEIVRLSYSTLT